MVETGIDQHGIAAREATTPRQVAFTLSLASLAHDVFEAALKGEIPHGIGLRELRDPPAFWPRQRVIVGF